MSLSESRGGTPCFSAVSDCCIVFNSFCFVWNSLQAPMISSYSDLVEQQCTMNTMLLRHHTLRRAIICGYSNQQRTYGTNRTGGRGGSEPRQYQQQQRRRQQQQWDDDGYSSYNSSRPPRRRVEKAPKQLLRRPGQQHTYLVSCHPGLEQVSTSSTVLSCSITASCAALQHPRHFASTLASV